ncbi:MAG: hypothetical protein KatS3mg102_0633 [Planctomycetota bacterium]|nr:MAG: hypothetical protein KatS3mg102_0633 [Planctomycetota bacterium]
MVQMVEASEEPRKASTPQATGSRASEVTSRRQRMGSPAGRASARQSRLAPPSASSASATRRNSMTLLYSKTSTVSAENTSGDSARCSTSSA